MNVATVCSNQFRRDGEAETGAAGTIRRLECLDKILDRYSEERRKVFDEVTSPVSTESFRLVFNSDDEERFANDLKRLKDRTTNLEEMRKFASVPALLETRSLLTGQTFAERALAASPANCPTY